MTTTTKNGSAAPGAAAKTETKTVEKSTATVTPDGLKETKPQTKVLTVEDRRARAEVFNKLLEKQENLKDVQKRVESFAVGSDENSQSLKLSDSKGNNFTTGNPVVLKDVLTLIRAQVNAQVGVIDTEILDFVI